MHGCSGGHVLRLYFGCIGDQVIMIEPGLECVDQVP